jgi:ATP-dependent Zn protease
LKYFKGLSFYIVLFVIILFILAIIQGGEKPRDMDYTRLLREIRNKNVNMIILEGNEATIELKEPEKACYVGQKFALKPFYDLNISRNVHAPIKQSHVSAPLHSLSAMLLYHFIEVFHYFLESAVHRV